MIFGLDDDDPFGHIAECEKEKEVLREEIRRLREALGFYCSPEAIVSQEGLRYWTDKGINDHGDVARLALGLEE